MKKKLALMCMAGIMVFGVSACGSKNADNKADTSETSVESDADKQSEEILKDSQMHLQSETTEGEKKTEEKVSDRPDYVALKDLNIDEYITLADYKNMKVSAVKSEVTDDIIENYINSTLLVGNITNRAVKEGDTANIDFEGKKDGVAFEGGTAQGFDLKIGSGSFIPGFEDGLIGVNAGETVDLELTFPENYQKEELAGQAVVFTVKVNSIKGTAEYETVTPEEMEAMGLEYTSKEEVWETGKKTLEENAAKAFETNSKSAIVQKLVEESTIASVPEYLVEEEMQNYTNYMETMVKSMYGVDLETFVTSTSGTMEEYNEQIKDMCNTTVKQYLAMEAVARAEGIEITDDMINDKASEEAAEYGYESAEALLDDVGHTTYRMYILSDKVMERLVQLVEVEATAAE